MKTKWLIYLAGLGLLLSCFIVGIAKGGEGTPEVRPPEVIKANPPQLAEKSIYTVQVGDSLSRIAYRVYGNESMWQEIYKLNPQITDPNMIYPGQLIALDPTIKFISRPRPLPVQPKVYARTEVYDKLIRHMFRVNDMKYLPREECEQFLDKHKKYLLECEKGNLYYQRLLAANVVEYSRKLEFYLLLDGIFEACKNDRDYKMTALLTALAWQESHFNNVTGKHGEITQFQFLPSTVKDCLELDDIGLKIVQWDLLNNNIKSSQLAYTWLMNNGLNKRNTVQALRWYNHNPQYANYVLWKYNKVIAIIKS